MESNADNDCKSDSENSYVEILRDEKEDYKKEDDDIEVLLGNSPTEADVVTQSDTEHVNVSVNMSKLFGFNIFFYLRVPLHPRLLRQTWRCELREGDKRTGRGRSLEDGIGGRDQGLEMLLFL